ncbi:MAG: pectin esterase [Clostridia bacterium]|nr:pectin esterase [Clostridia bacterium]
MKTIRVTPKDDLQNILSDIGEPTTIYLTAGVYRQKIVVCADDVKIIGEGRETTVITYSDYAKKPHSDGGEYNTFRTFTVCVTGERCVIENLTIENSNTRPEEVGQCVALSVNAKLFRAKCVDLKSTQDTLFTAPFPDDLVVRYSGLTDDPAYYDGFIPRDQLYMEGGSLQLYENCRIYGTVDFIFGGAEAYFKDCELISLHEKRKTGYVAAPCHHLREDKGYAFIDCRFVSGGAENGSVYLARPWRDYGKCDFVNCTLSEHINPELFDKWNDTYRDKTARFAYSGLSGAKISPVKWGKELSAEKANDIINTYHERKRKYFDEF